MKRLWRPYLISITLPIQQPTYKKLALIFFFCYITDAFKVAEADDDDDSEEDMDSDATEEQGSTEDEDTPDEDEEDEEEYIGGDFNEDVSYFFYFLINFKIS